MENMSLAELKKTAKGRKIKQYYIMKKEDLLRLLQLADKDELPSKYKIEKMTITELREIAKNRGLIGFWRLSKEDLTNMLFLKEEIHEGSAHQKDHNDCKAREHQNPEHQDAQNVGVKMLENP